MPSTSHGKQKQVDKATLSHYLTSVHELYLLTIFPDYQPEISTGIYEILLASHAAHFRALASPFGAPNAQSRTAVQGGTAVFPGTTDVSLEVYDGEAKIACLISDRLAIDEVEALVLFRRFRREEHELMQAQEIAEESQSKHRSVGLGAGPSQSTKGRPLSDTLLNLIVKFYWQEHLSLVHLLSALLRRSNDDSDVSMEHLLGGHAAGMPRDVKAAAISALDEVIGQDRKAFVYELFRQFGSAMHVVVEQETEEMLRAGIIHTLELQVSILESLLLYNYFGAADMTANLSRGLINGALACSFGAAQANGRLIERMPGTEAQDLIAHIQHLLALICIDALRLNDLLEEDRVALDYDVVQNLPDEDRTLAQSPQHIASVHDTLGTASCRNTEPFAVVLLAWACFLCRLQEQSWLLPGQGDLQPRGAAATPVHVRVGQIALDPQLDVFAKWQRLLTGRLLWQDQAGSRSVEDAPIYKDISRVLLSALPQLVRFTFIPDYYGLIDVWTCCYGQGEAQAVAQLCYTAWQEPDAAGWTELLTTTQFPHHARTTLRLLTAMTGAGSVSDSPSLSLMESAATSASTLQLLKAMPSISVAVGPQSRLLACCETVRDDDGVAFLVNNRPLRIPGGSVISAWSSGRVISRPGSATLVVRWDGSFDVLGLLVAAVAAATGHRSDEEHVAAKPRTSEGADVSHSATAGLVWLTLADTGILLDSLEDGQLLQDILDLFQAIIRAEPAAATVFAQLGVSPLNPGGLSALLLKVVKQGGARARQNDELSLANISTATNIVVSLAEHAPGPVWDLLRRSNFFLDISGTPSIARSIMTQELRSGSYRWTTALLRMLLVLTTHFLGQRLTEPADMARQQEEALLKAMSFVISSIWSEFGNWRYQRSADKALIGNAVCILLLRWLQDPLFDQACQGVVAGGSICNSLREGLILAPSTIALTPLLDAIRLPISAIPVLLQRNRKADAARTEAYLASSLLLLATLLRRARRISPRTAALETMLVTPTEVHGTSRKRTLLDIIFRYSSSNTIFNEMVAECSLQVNNIVAGNLALIQNNSAPMLTCLDDATATMSELVAVVLPPYRSAALVKETWAFLTTAAVSQPGLARIAAGSTIVSAAEGDDKQESALGAALEIVENAFDESRSNAWNVDPRLLTSALRFLVSLRQRMPDALESNKFADNARLWSAIDRLCRTMQTASPQQSWSAEQDDASSEAAQDAIDQVTAYAHRRTARALALDLLVCCTEAHLQSSKGQQCALQLLSDKETCPGLVAEAAHNSLDVDLHRQIYGAILADGQRVNIDDLKDDRDRDERELGSQYLFDVNATLIVLGRAASGGDPLGIALQAVNVDWSAADADSHFTRSWTKLLESACVLNDRRAGISQNAIAAGSRILPQLQEPRRGLTMAHIQGERLLLLRAAVVIACGPEAPDDKLQMDEVAEELTVWLADPAWGPQVLARETDASLSYVTAFEVLLLLLGKLGDNTADSVGRGRGGRQIFNRLVAGVAASTSAALAVRAEAGNNPGGRSADDDLTLFYAILHATTARSLNPDGPMWLATLDDHGILRQSLAWIETASLESESQLSAAKSILQFHAGVVQHSAAAEVLQRLRFIPAYVESALLNPSSLLYVAPIDDTPLGPRHALWTQALNVVNDLFVTQSRSTHVDAQQVESVIDRVRDQAGMVLSWDLDTPYPIERLADLQQVTHLFYHLMRAAGPADRSHEPLMTAYAPQAVALLNAIAAAFGTTRYLRQVVQEAMQRGAAGSGFAEQDPSEADVDQQIGAVKACLLDVGHVVVQTLMAWTETAHILRRDQTGFLARPRRLSSLVSPGLASPVQELLDFAAAVTEEGDSLLAAPPGEARAGSTSVSVALLPAAPLAALVGETVEMATLLAAGQAVLAWEQVGEAARRAAQKTGEGVGAGARSEAGTGNGPAEGGADGKARGDEEMTGQDKQSLRDLKDFVSKMADKQELYRECYTMLRHRIPQMDDL